jgi:hypothetical protein
LKLLSLASIAAFIKLKISTSKTISYSLFEEFSLLDLIIIKWGISYEDMTNIHFGGKE